MDNRCERNSVKQSLASLIQALVGRSGSRPHRRDSEA